jgi:hypothetical protein
MVLRSETRAIRQARSCFTQAGKRLMMVTTSSLTGLTVWLESLT